MNKIGQFEHLMEQKHTLLQKLEDELITAQKRLSQCTFEQEAIKEKQHRLMLLEAGNAVERAGLLGKCDMDDLYLFLLTNKHHLLKKG